MTTLLPRDDDNTPNQPLRLKAGKAQSLSVTATSARNTTAFAADTRVIAVYATGPSFIRSGDSTVEAAATDHYLPGGTYLYLSLGQGKAGRDTHLAAIRVSADVTLYISEMA
ncbi:MAG: hypothetical protein J4G10_07805 [Alphaproteobacteria bacterium]|nr:hypothetical protein [Alphaproteobacteria bacterium]